MTIRIQFDGSGNFTESNPDRPTTLEGSTLAPAPAVRQQGPMRVLLDTETGIAHVEESRPSEYRPQPAQQGGVTVRSVAGLPTSLAQAASDAVVNLPGLGETSVAAAVTMGYLQPRSGGGFELVQQPAQSQEQPKAQTQEREEKDEAVNSKDAEGIPPMSDASDALLSTLQTKAPMALEGIIESISRGVIPETLYADVARQLGDEDFAANASQMHSEYVASGQAALRNVGVEQGSMEGFEAWARAKHPEEANNAIRDMVNGKSVARLQKLGREFVRTSNQRIITALEAKGVQTFENNGSVLVVIDGKTKTLRSAIRSGEIEING